VVRSLIVLAGSAAALGLPTCAAAHPTTTETIFRAFASTGVPTIQTQSKSGYCFTGSSTIDRKDAWRCFVGNFVHDPCFSSAHAAGIVVCPNLKVNGGIEIHLTRALPHGSANAGEPSLSDQPWNIELTGGQHCAFSSGASNVVHGKRLNYFCGPSSKTGLWGYPDRHAEPWTILIAPFTATTLHERHAIRQVWM
jgi:hypothetical protein